MDYVKLVRLTSEHREKFIKDIQEAFRYGAMEEFGLILNIDGKCAEGELEILFVSPLNHSKGIGTRAWAEVEKLHPEVVKWTTYTPYFETRNIHFYVNRLGFHIVEFLHKGHKDTSGRFFPEDDEDMMFKFEKNIARKTRSCFRK